MFISRIEKYVDSVFYPLTIAVLTFVGWVAGFALPSAILFAVFSFLPLFGKDGRSYIALILLSPTLIAKPLSFTSLSIDFIICACSIVVSIIVFTIIRRPHFRIGKMTMYLGILFVIFLLSLVINSARTHTLNYDAVWFLLSMILILLVYVLLTPLFYEKDVFTYLAECLAVLVTVLSAQIITYYLRIGYSHIGSTINLGWVQSSTMASTILVIVLPFLSMLIGKKKWIFFIPMALSLLALYQLRTVSGVICTVLIIIPLVFLTFKNFKYFPYYVIASFFVIGGVLSILLLVNDEFVNIMGNSLRYFASFFTGEIENHQLGIEYFLSAPILGTSINTLYLGETGYISLLDNTIITTLVMGGSIGLIAYIIFDIRLYILTFQVRNHERFFFLTFLICGEIIGLIDNTFYNLFFLFILLLSTACFESSNASPKLVVEQKFFNNYVNKRR